MLLLFLGFVIKQLMLLIKNCRFFKYIIEGGRF